MNQSLRFLIVILPILVLGFFTKVLLVDDDIKFTNFESKSFPSFELKDLNGDPVNARSLDGIKIVNVWASWCITCLVEHPFLTKLAEENILKFNKNNNNLKIYSYRIEQQYTDQNLSFINNNLKRKFDTSFFQTILKFCS